MKNTKRNLNKKAFTLVELTMAMTVMAIILTAVATLAFALSSANDSADDSAEFQARLRYASLEITNLIKNCKLICENRGDRIALWRNDDNGDAKINPAELVYIEYKSTPERIRILEFVPDSSSAGWQVPIGDIQNGNIRSWLSGRAVWNYTNLLEDCVVAEFVTDTAAPFSNMVTLKMGFTRQAQKKIYQINASLRCYAGHLLDSSGQITSDDDEY